MWMLAVMAAFGRSVVEDAGAAAALHGGAVVECAPAGDVFALLSNLPASVTSASPVLRMVSAGDPASVGLDPAGRLLAFIDGGGAFTVEVPFTGDAAAAERLLSVGSVPPPVEGAGWRVGQGSKPVHVELASGALRFSSGSGAGGPGVPVPPELLAGLPTAPGCAVVTPEGLGKPGGKPLPRMVAYLPLEGKAPLVVRVAATEPQLAVMGGTPAPVPDIRTEIPPTFLLVSTMPLQPMVEALAGMKGTPPGGIGEALAAVQSTHEQISLPGGMVVATWGNPKNASDIAVVLPIRDRAGRPIPPKRAVKALVHADLGTTGAVLVSDLTSTGKGTFSGRMGGKPAFGAFTRDGRLVVATSAALVEQIRGGEGQPWLSPEQARWAAEWPIAMMGADPAGNAHLLSGVRPRAGAYEIALEIQTPAATAAMRSTMVGLLGGIAIPNFVAMQQKAKRAEVAANVDGIRVAELSYDAAFDQYVAVPVGPRPVTALDGRLAPWVGGPGWTDIGWKPDGDVRGTYWVELSADGMSFTVHGMADVDGDGIPCEYVATPEGAAHAVTPGDRY